MPEDQAVEELLSASAYIGQYVKSTSERSAVCRKAERYMFISRRFNVKHWNWDHRECGLWVARCAYGCVQATQGLRIPYFNRWFRLGIFFAQYAQGFTSPAPRDFVGFGPLTEPESLTAYNFALSYNFNLVLAYHTQGKEIYWQFKDFNPPNSLQIGEEFSRASGYKLSETPYNSSFAGFKDWFIQDFNKPGYTIEAGVGENPLPISQFDEIYKDNIGILILGAIL